MTTAMNGHQPEEAHQRPVPLRVNPEHLPAELRALRQWVVWRYDLRPGKGGKPVWTKPPFAPNGGDAASSTDPATWVSFTEALAAYEGGRWDGLGLIHLPDDNLGVIDLDHVRDPQTGVIQPWAAAIVVKMDTYTEVSPSGTGLRIVGHGRKPGRKAKRGQVEIYDGVTANGKPGGRYLTFTGHRLEGTPAEIGDRQDQLSAVYQQYLETAEPNPKQATVSIGTIADQSNEQPGKTGAFLDQLTAIWTPPDGPLSDEDLVKLAESGLDEKLTRLWGGDITDYSSQSEADLALCCKILWWMSRPHGDRLDGLFRQSKLMRPKWDEKHGEKTYGQLTIVKAILLQTDFRPPANAAGVERPAFKPSEEGEENPDLIRTAADIPTLADARAAGASKHWQWEGWLQADVLNGLAGEFGHGKTRLVAELIRRIRAGECWPDGSPMTLPTDSRFLFVPADYQHSELCDLADKYGFPEECIYINAMKENADGVSLFDSPQAMKCLEKRIAILRPALVVIDPITGTRTADRSHNVAEGGTALYGPLQLLARKYGVTFLILIHLNSHGGTYGRHATGKFRTEMTLTKVETEEGERFRLEVTKSNSKKPEALGATQQEGRWDFDQNPPEKDAGSSKRGPKPVADVEAVNFLKQQLAGGERKQVEVVAAWVDAGHSKKTIFAAARRMEGEGELLCDEVESPRGRTMLKTWKLPPTATLPFMNGDADPPF